MADNITVNTLTGSPPVRTDDIGGVHYPASKISLGADNTDDGFVSSANPLPIAGTAASGAALPAVQMVIAGYDTGAEATRALEITSNGEILCLIQNLGEFSQYVVGDALGATPEGDLMIARRDDLLTSLTPTDGQAVEVRVDRYGRIWTHNEYALPADTWRYSAATGGITNTTDVAAKTSAGTGIRNYVTRVSVVNAHATVGTEVVIKDGSTVMWRGYAVAGGGGLVATFDPPLRGSAATAVNVANITTGAQTYFNLQGYVSEN